MENCILILKSTNIFKVIKVFWTSQGKSYLNQINIKIEKKMQWQTYW